MEELTPQQLKELKIVARFMEVYCRAHHSDQQPDTVLTGFTLCGDCESLLAYAMGKRRKCPLDPKPSCKHCHIHCYSKDHRARMKEIMSFSGRHMIMRGRLDYLWHYFF